MNKLSALFIMTAEFEKSLKLHYFSNCLAILQMFFNELQLIQKG